MKLRRSLRKDEDTKEHALMQLPRAMGYVWKVGE